MEKKFFFWSSIKKDEENKTIKSHLKRTKNSTEMKEKKI